MRHATVEVLSLAELRRSPGVAAARDRAAGAHAQRRAHQRVRRKHRAMVVLANAPCWRRRFAHRPAGAGGVLLNRNLAFIDHINEIVYPDGCCPSAARARPRCSSTTCASAPTCACSAPTRHARDRHARVSQTVRDAVLGEGATWLDRAFVVGDWYVSAYEPLVDGAGQRVGMLYVGFLEQPFTWLKYGALAAIGLIFFAVMVGAALLSLRGARGIFRPSSRWR